MARSKQVVILGGLAAGPKVASRLMRLEPEAHVTIVERGTFMSYAGCGLPYYVAGDVDSRIDLMCTPLGEVRDPVFFREARRMTVHNRTDALRIDRDGNRVLIQNLDTGEEQWLQYDKLVICTGGRPRIPDPMPGTDLPEVYCLHRVEDAEGIREEISSERALDVVIVGGGLIGVEVTEALVNKGCRVTILEARESILHLLDPEMSALVARHLESHGVRILTETRPHSIQPEDGRVAAVRTLDGKHIPADMVILAVGMEPAVDLAREAGLAIGETGGIAVNDLMRTNDHDIYAAGDCVETRHLVSGRPTYLPMGSTANKMGRVAANAICGVRDHFPGVVGSAICKVFDFNVARTGLSLGEARAAGYDADSVLAPGPDRPHFMPGAATLLIKLVYDRASRRLLGVQVIGPGEADRRVDVAAMAVTMGWTVDQLANADLSYAPPYSPAMDNLITAANVARNKLDGLFHGVAPDVLHGRLAGDEVVLLDVRTPDEVAEDGELPGAINIPLCELRQRLDEVPRDREVVTFCTISLRGYEAALILEQNGYQQVRVLDGGVSNWPYELQPA